MILILVIGRVETSFYVKNVKIIIEPLVTIVLNVARPIIWQEDVATIIRQSGKLKKIVGTGQPAITEALPKKCYNFKKFLFEKYSRLYKSLESRNGTKVTDEK